MKGFISVTQINNQGSYINISHITRIDKTTKGCDIYIIGSDKIETATDFDKIENLINNARPL